MTILVIDDSRFMQRAVDKVLREAGYRTLLVSDGEQGLKTAIEQKPDLILLDVMLPSLPGTSVLRSLKHNIVTERIPVIVLTGLTRLDKGKLKSEGADGFMAKPECSLEDGWPALLNLIRKSLTHEHIEA